MGIGCCKSEQKYDENAEVYSFFHKMEKEANLEYSIENYDENYNKIKSLSSNKFKKLEKKQSLRLNFLNEILSNLNINKIYIGEKEEKITKKILFYLLVLNLTLTEYIKENEEIKSINDMEQLLLTLSTEILNKSFANPQNMKLIIFYTSKMLIILFKYMENIQHFINMDQYIAKLKFLTENDYLCNDELYPFLKINLLCLGEYFDNSNDINFKSDAINIIIKYYAYMYFYKTRFISKNYIEFKKILYNKIYSTRSSASTKANSDSINYKKSPSHSSNNSKITKSNSKDSKISVEEKLEINNEYSKLTKNKSYEDIISITESFYSFLKVVIEDVNSGTEIFKIFDENFSRMKKLINVNSISNNHDDDSEDVNTNIIENDTTRKKTKQGRVKRTNTIKEVNDEMKTHEIFVLLLLSKSDKKDKKISLCFLEYLAEKIKDNIRFGDENKYYSITNKLFEIFNKDENTKERNMTLLSQIFIKEIENRKKNGEFIIDKILNTNFNVDLLVSFMYNISLILKENKYGDKFLTAIISKLSQLMEKFITNAENIYCTIINYENNEASISNGLSLDSGSIYINNNNTNIQMNEKNKIDIEKLYCIIRDINILNFDNNLNKKLNLKNKATKKYSITDKKYSIIDNDSYLILLDSYIKFTINFFSFVENNYNFSVIYKDKINRKNIFKKIIALIVKLESVYLLEGGEVYHINELVTLIKILIYIIHNNSFNFFEDFEIITNYLKKNFQELINIPVKEVKFSFVKIIYSVLIFIIIRLKIIFRIPNSIIKIHKEIMEAVSRMNSKYLEIFEDINIPNYQTNKLSKQFYLKLSNEWTNYLKIKYKNNCDLNIEEYKEILDIIYTKLVSDTASISVYFKSQLNQIKNGKLFNDLNISDDFEDDDEFNDVDEWLDSEKNGADIFVNLGINDIKKFNYDKKNETIDGESACSYSLGRMESQKINTPDGDISYHCNTKDNESFSDLCENNQLFFSENLKI